MNFINPLVKIIILFFFISCIDFKFDKKYRSISSKTSAKSCSKLLMNLIKETSYDEASAKQLKESFNKFFKISPERILGSKVPRQKDIEDLKKILTNFEEIKKNINFPTEKDEIDFFGRVFAESQIYKNHFSTLTNFSKNTLEINNLKVLEIEFLLYFRTLVEKFNLYLPKNVQFKLGKIETGNYLEKLKSEAREIVSNQKVILKDLFHTTGFKSLNEYRKHLDKNRSLFGDIVDVIRDEDVEISIKIPSDKRWWIPKTGIHNRYVTRNTTEGYSELQRKVSEASMSGKSFKDYSLLNNDIKPKYGLLSPKTSSNIKAVDTKNYANYGDDIYIFDIDKIRDRITWTPGDSLIRHMYANNSLYQGKVMELESWDDLFLPWEARELSIPNFNKKYNNGRLALSRGEYGTKGNSIEIGSRKKLNFRTNDMSGDYMEIQIWGPIRISDIKEFIFKENPPTGEFLEELIENKVKIFDGRKQFPVEWKPYN